MLNSLSFNKDGKSIKFLNKNIEIADGKAPIVFNISHDSKLCYYNGAYFIFQDKNEKIKAKLHIYWRYYPGGHGFPYKESEVIVSVFPVIDKDLNFYCIEGTPEGLQVIKYVINKEVWE